MSKTIYMDDIVDYVHREIHQSLPYYYVDFTVRTLFFLIMHHLAAGDEVQIPLLGKLKQHTHKVNSNLSKKTLKFSSTSARLFPIKRLRQYYYMRKPDVEMGVSFNDHLRLP